MCVCVCVYTIASFPSLLHLQFLIACSMQTRRWKTWGILSHDPRHIFAYCKRSKTGDVEGLGMRLSQAYDGMCVCVHVRVCVLGLHDMAIFTDIDSMRAHGTFFGRERYLRKTDN